MNNFDDWFKESGIDEECKSIAETAWNGALDGAKDILADAGSQHFDNELESYIDSFELLEN